VLLGFHKPVLSQTLLGGVVHQVMREVPAPVGVFVDRGFEAPRRVLVPFQGSPHDRAALALAQRLMSSAGAEVTILHVIGSSEKRKRMGASDLVGSVFEEDSGRVTLDLVENESPSEAVLERSRSGFDLVVVGVGREWGLSDRRLIGLQPERLMNECPASLLVVRDRLERRRRSSHTLPPRAEARLAGTTIDV
jgi:nucleotide-binding universal stress UspA family protein